MAARPPKTMKLPAEVDIDRLQQSVRESLRQLRPFREKRLQMVKLAAGSEYGENTTKYETPFNLFGLYISVMARFLVGKTPQAMLSADGTDPAVAACEGWANEEAMAMCLGDTLQRAATDALFTMGIVKVGLASPGDAATRGWGIKAGAPFARVVDFEDYVCDLHAKDWSEVSYEGHRYRMPLAAAKVMFRMKKGEELVGDDDRDYNEDGDERITLLQRGATSSRYEFEDHISLWELYLPRHQLIVTFLDDAANGLDITHGVLSVERWIGPAKGPYHRFRLGQVAGNLIPKTPAMDLVLLQKALNRGYRKLIEDTDRWKSILPVSSADAGDITAITEARNGTAVKFDGRTDSLKEVTFGGPGQGVVLMMQQLERMFNFLSGNLPMIAGLSPQSKTAAQDKMLAENASRTVGDMQDTAVRFAADVFESLTYWWWKHPEKVMQSEYKVEGVPELRIMRQVHPRTAAPRDESGRRRLVRSGPVPKVKIDPYSLAHQTPQQRLAFLDATVAGVIPIMGLLQQQGVVFDASRWMELKAKFGQEPEIMQLFSLQEPIAPRPGGDGGGDTPGMPANTSREYVRRSVGSETPDSQQADMVNAAASGDEDFNAGLGA